MVHDSSRSRLTNTAVAWTDTVVAWTDTEVAWTETAMNVVRVVYSPSFFMQAAPE